MGKFEKGNTYSKGRPKGSKNKKTIAKESLNTLNKIGINPMKVSKQLIDALVQNTELSNKDQIALLNSMTSLYKYQLLTRAEEIRLDELMQENEEIKQENEQLKRFVGTPQDLMKELEKVTK